MRIQLPILLTLVLIALVGYAENAKPAAADQAAATTGAAPASVGRIDFASGNVAIYQLGQTDWTRAEVGLPLASGGWLATDPKARAQIRIGPASIGIANDTELSLADLQQQAAELSLSRGRIDVELQQRPQGGGDRIDVPGGVVQLVEPGSYDITVGTNGQPTRIAVFAGSARFAGSGLEQTVTSGNALVVNAAGKNRTASVEPAKPDEFARWSRSRGNAPQTAAAEQPQPAPAPNTGNTQPQEPAASEPVESRAEPVEHRARHTRVERHRRVVHRHYVRHFRRRYYGYRSYGYAAPAIPNPLGVIGSILGGL